MVALLYIQAIIQYRFDVFGIVETATVVKNKKLPFKQFRSRIYFH